MTSVRVNTGRHVILAALLGGSALLSAESFSQAITPEDALKRGIYVKLFTAKDMKYPDEECEKQGAKQIWLAYPEKMGFGYDPSADLSVRYSEHEFFHVHLSEINLRIDPEIALIENFNGSIFCMAEALLPKATVTISYTYGTGHYELTKLSDFIKND